MFPIKNFDKISTREPKPVLPKETTKHRKYKLKLQQEFINETIVDKKYINHKVFWNFFKGYLHYETITSQNGSSEVQVKNFCILLKS